MKFIYIIIIYLSFVFNFDLKAHDLSSKHELPHLGDLNCDQKLNIIDLMKYLECLMNPLSTETNVCIVENKSCHSYFNKIVYEHASDADGVLCENTIDSDFDGVCDKLDVCSFDPYNDLDGDGLCGDIDPCPFDVENDFDQDGLCGVKDPCPLDKNNDIDGDSFCSNLDLCPNDFENDIDLDGICGDVDICPFDVNNDIDKDGLCAADDICPLDPLNDIDKDGLCSDEDPCPENALNELDASGLCLNDYSCDGEVNFYTKCQCSYEPSCSSDIDSDDVCDSIDICPNDIDNDIDGDLLCFNEDPCPFDPLNSISESGECLGAMACSLSNYANDEHCDLQNYSCLDILNKYPSSKNGIYYISLEGEEQEVAVFCDMESDGGGWTLAIKGVLDHSYENSFNKDVSDSNGFMKSFHLQPFHDILVKLGPVSVSSDWVSFYNISDGNQTLDKVIKNYQVDENSFSSIIYDKKSPSLASCENVKRLSFLSKQNIGPQDIMFFTLTADEDICGDYLSRWKDINLNERILTSQCVGMTLGFYENQSSTSNWQNFQSKSQCPYVGYGYPDLLSCSSFGGVFVR